MTPPHVADESEEAGSRERQWRGLRNRGSRDLRDDKGASYGLHATITQVGVAAQVEASQQEGRSRIGSGEQ